MGLARLLRCINVELWQLGKMSKLVAVLLFFAMTTCDVKCYDDYNEHRPLYLTASVGDYIILNCDLDFPESMPIPYKLVWRKEGETIFTYYNGVMTSAEPYVGRIHLLNNPDYQIYDRATVNLTSIRDTDGGWFQCRVIFPNRTPTTRNNGTWYHLTVNGGNLLAIPPINQTIFEGDKAQFTCLPRDMEMKVTWYKDGVSIREYQELVQRTWTMDDGTLIINGTEIGDYGEYECEVIHETGERQTARAFLNVEYKAKVLYADPEIHLPFGRPAIIDCHFSANPPLTNLRWEKDGFLYDPYNIQGVFYKKNGSLYFTKVDESHNGRYTCTPFNKLGTQGPSPIMLVTVQRPPVFIVSPQNLYIKKLGEPIEIPCDARDGENGHKPIIIWYKKDGTSLPVGRYSINDGYLSIMNVQEEDRGLYICSATNKAATITAETELLVESIPYSAPYNLTGVTSTQTVFLRWEAGRQRSNVNYSVWYKPVDNTEWKTQEVPPSVYLESTIDNLDPGREYEFMVLCKDDQGDGLFSKAIRLWTKRTDGQSVDKPSNTFSPPVGFPRNVTVFPSYNGYMVTWQPPESGLDRLKYYEIRWTQGPDDYPLGSAETRNTSFHISSLPEGNQYNIQVISVSEDDQQAVSELVSVKIPEYRRVQAVSTGIIAGMAFLVVASVVVYYVKKKWCKSKLNGGTTEKNGKT